MTTSPVASSWSISRLGGRLPAPPLICSARATSWSVVLPIALTTTTTSSPRRFAATALAAQRAIRSASATLVPPNF